MDRSVLGRALLALGVVLVVAGVVLYVTDGDGESTTPSAADATTTTTAPASTTTAPATTTTTTVRVSTTTASTTTVPASTTTVPASTTTTTTSSESTDAFFAVLKGALDGGDAATLVDRLNPATIDRYGRDQCEAYAESVAGTGLDAVVQAVRDLASWDYTTDGATTTISDVVAVDLERVINDQSVPSTTHWQSVDGRYTWFTDCGTPV